MVLLLSIPSRFWWKVRISLKCDFFWSTFIHKSYLKPGYFILCCIGTKSNRFSNNLTSVSLKARLPRCEIVFKQNHLLDILSDRVPLFLKDSFICFLMSRAHFQTYLKNLINCLRFVTFHNRHPSQISFS